jgi:hypothetical protein
MGYQDRLFALGKEIIKCDKCKKDWPDKPGALYKHGPEISYVGPKYGLNGSLRILFTRLNPVWDPEVGFMGTKESVEAYLGENEKATPKKFYTDYLKGWPEEASSGKGNSPYYRGIRVAGTVTGHPNNQKRTDKQLEESVTNPKYGIQVIMQKLVDAGVFHCTDKNSLLEFCAINNVVKCAGNGPRSHPSREMSINCREYYLRELEILKPHIVVGFGNKANNQMRQLNKKAVQGGGSKPFDSCHHRSFPHPLGGGLNSWKGKGIGEPKGQMTEYDKQLFKAGKDGSATRRLWKLVLCLVEDAQKELEAALSAQK